MVGFRLCTYMRWFVILFTLTACEPATPVTYPWILPMTVDTRIHIQDHYCRCYDQCEPRELEPQERVCLESIPISPSPTTNILYCELYVQAELYNCLQTCSTVHDLDCEAKAVQDQIYCDSICPECERKYQNIQGRVEACWN